MCLNSFVLIMWLFSPHKALMAADAESQVVASAPDGFTVTATQVEEMKKFFTENTPVEAPDTEMERYTVCAYLLAREAERQGLSLPQDFQPLAPVHTVLARAQSYFDLTVTHYLLDPLVVESYYKAHFEEYVAQGQDASLAEDWQKGLSPEVQQRIRQDLLQHKQKEIASTLCDDLKKKYSVKERGSSE